MPRWDRCRGRRPRVKLGDLDHVASGTSKRTVITDAIDKHVDDGHRRDGDGDDSPSHGARAR